MTDLGRPSNLVSLNVSGEHEQPNMIRINEGDLLEVDPDGQIITPSADKPESWVQGKNLGSGRSGYFPGPYVRRYQEPVAAPRRRMDTSAASPKGPHDSGFFGSPQRESSNSQVHQ